MAGEYDERFDEITGLLQKAAGGLEELRMEVRDIRNDLGENTRVTKVIEQNLAILSGQFRDVGGLVLKDHKPRIEKIEERLDVLESQAH